MKKIIEGRLYNTDTAKELGVWSNIADVRNFHWYCERLYQKRTGEYFLHGEGGPMTQYAVTLGQNSWSGGEKIIPLTPEAARQWAEEHLDADRYAEIFGMPDEGSTEKVTICMQIPGDLDAIIRAKAAENGVSLTAYVTEVLNKACRG